MAGVVRATTTIESFRLSSDQLLPIAANLAAAMGTDLQEATLTLSKAAAGSSEGFQSLRDTHGITTKELLKFGASQGEVQGSLSNLESDIEQNRNALLKLIQTRFRDATARQSKTFQGALSNVGDAPRQPPQALARA